MNLDRYEFSAGRTLLDFEFCSEGPNGKIIKIIRFNPVNSNGITYFNLGFGDMNPETEIVDDQSISNNQNRTKILATVAYAVLEFTSLFYRCYGICKGKHFSKNTAIPNGHFS